MSKEDNVTLKVHSMTMGTNVSIENVLRDKILELLEKLKEETKDDEQGNHRHDPRQDAQLYQE